MILWACIYFNVSTNRLETTLFRTKEAAERAAANDWFNVYRVTVSPACVVEEN